MAVYNRRRREDMINRYMDLLLKCPGTMDLVLDFTDFDFDDLDLLGAMQQMRLQRLAINVPLAISTWKLAGLHDPSLLSLTHLDLYQEEAAQQYWCGLATLPALMRLALLPSVATAILATIVTECTRLELVIVMAYSWMAASDNTNLVSTVTDPRVVTMTMEGTHKTDWELGVSGGDDFWARAIAFDNRKRSGEIDRDCYVLDETPTTQPP
ncbi:hypothetical protein DFH08DRAFT_889888 [Mycena albidolilacea]|uniref:Uncharacterized protein n=1 Tax=Mycena albidolilacea TaxID=1033008 RepID=A0AAD6ZG15_9AGAR|nr:hypothetical protein DFH08DRAFT_889888 [Mycena albidolilacea]